MVSLITEYAGTIPVRTQTETEFNANVDTKLAWDVVSAAERNVQAQEMNADALSVYAALASTSSEVIALTATMWAAGDYTQGDVVWSPINSLMYRAKSTFTSSVDPSSDETNWVAWRESRTEFVSRTSNSELTIGDQGRIIYLSGTFTQTIASVAGLGFGWSVLLKNAGTGTITIDPYSSETIDGLSGFAMLPGESRMVFHDDTNLKSIVLNAFTKTYTSSTTLVVPPGYSKFGYRIASASGGGGSGMRSDTTTILGGAGGAGGGLFYGECLNPTAGGTLTITVGAGGTGGAAQTTNSTVGISGTAGGSSSLSGAGFDITVTGGGYGTGGKDTTFGSGSSGYGGGVGYFGSVNAGHVEGGFLRGGSEGEFGGAAAGTADIASGPDDGNPSIWGGATGAGGAWYDTTAQSVGVAGTSTYGSDGADGGAVETAGSDAVLETGKAPGGGGGGGSSRNGTASGAGGDGADGWITLWGII